MFLGRFSLFFQPFFSSSSFFNFYYLKKILSRIRRKLLSKRPMNTFLIWKETTKRNLEMCWQSFGFPGEGRETKTFIISVLLEKFLILFFHHFIISLLPNNNNCIIFVFFKWNWISEERIRCCFSLFFSIMSKIHL